MKPMSQEELEELKRQIGTPKPLVLLPQIKDEDMPTIREMVRNLKPGDGEDSEDDEGEGRDEMPKV